MPVVGHEDATRRRRPSDGKRLVSSASDGRRSRAKGSPAPAPSPPARGENSVYRIAPDGTVREVFREKALVLSLLRAGRPVLRRHRHGRPALRGRRGDHANTARSPGWITARFLRCAGGTTAPSSLGTGDPGKLYVLQDRYAAKGTIISEVLDAKLISKWGALRWQADTPAGTSVTRGRAQRQRRRAGRDLERLVGRADRRRSRRPSPRPPARFLQYRVTLTTDRPGT